MFIQPTPAFYEFPGETTNGKRSFKFLFGYIKQYHQYFGQIILGALVGCLLQLIFPFLTQAIVDIGIKHQNLNHLPDFVGTAYTDHKPHRCGFYPPMDVAPYQYAHQHLFDI